MKELQSVHYEMPELMETKIQLNETKKEKNTQNKAVQKNDRASMAVDMIKAAAVVRGYPLFGQTMYIKDLHDKWSEQYV